MIVVYIDFQQQSILLLKQNFTSFLLDFSRQSSDDLRMVVQN